MKGNGMGGGGSNGGFYSGSYGYTGYTGIGGGNTVGPDLSKVNKDLYFKLAKIYEKL